MLFFLSLFFFFFLVYCVTTLQTVCIRITPKASLQKGQNKNRNAYLARKILKTSANFKSRPQYLFFFSSMVGARRYFEEILVNVSDGGLVKGAKHTQKKKKNTNDTRNVEVVYSQPEFSFFYSSMVGAYSALDFTRKKKHPIVSKTPPTKSRSTYLVFFSL